MLSSSAGISGFCCGRDAFTVAMQTKRKRTREKNFRERIMMAGREIEELQLRIGRVGRIPAREVDEKPTERTPI